MQLIIIHKINGTLRNSYSGLAIDCGNMQMIMCSMYLQARNIKSLSFPLDTSYQPHQANKQWPSLKAPLEIYNDVLENHSVLHLGLISC